MDKELYTPTDYEYTLAMNYAIASAKTGEPACMVCSSMVDISKVFVCDYGAVCDNCLTTQV